MVIKTIQFYSPLSPSHGSALICKYCQLNYKDKFNNVISYQDGKKFVANTECDRNEFLLLPIPIETDWLKLFPIPGFGRRALNFQIEILGNQVDLGQPLGLSDGRIRNEQIVAAPFLDQSSHPRLNRSTWDFSTLSHNEIPAVGIEFGSRVIIGGFVFRSLAKSQTAVPMTHFDVSFLDLNGNERSHYDGKAVGENIHACDSLSSTHTVGLNVRIKTNRIILYPKTIIPGTVYLELEVLGQLLVT